MMIGETDRERGEEITRRNERGIGMGGMGMKEEEERGMGVTLREVRRGGGTLNRKLRVDHQLRIRGYGIKVGIRPLLRLLEVGEEDRVRLHVAGTRLQDQ